MVGVGTTGGSKRTAVRGDSGCRRQYDQQRDNTDGVRTAPEAADSTIIVEKARAAGDSTGV